MSTLLADFAQYYRDSGVIDMNSDYTVSMLVAQVGVRVDDGVIFCGGGAGDHGEYELATIYGVSNTLGLSITGTGALLGTSLGLLVPHYITIRRSGTAFEAFLDGTLDVSRVYDVSARGATGRFEFGGYGVSRYNSCLVYMQDVKMWQAALSPAEIAAEIASPGTVVRTTNLYAHYPMTGAIADLPLDASGNGNHLTGWGVEVPGFDLTAAYPGAGGGGGSGSGISRARLVNQA